ncbi:uncharacterized protein CXorf65 homolog [Pimephales promelas]|uniref:uncharacterized protein CXorf65 homolog n=1 Tax=Pimephales promelas TaxID=90988 RepID=UPI001955A998|nr:uncharacterized protein CXorf65 homolog [Pimephales promelas]KAG1929170.1 hypothetical protein F2P79_023104 [Pimephales promelas]
MFIYIKHGDNDQFMVNTNCTVVVLMQYMKTRLQLAESELIDLCDEQGELKFLFVPQNSQKSACGLLKARESFTACIIKRTSDGAYTSVTSLLSNVHSGLKETLQTQIDNHEKTRLKQLRFVEATSMGISDEALLKITKRRKKVTLVNAGDEVQRHTGDRKKNRN